MNDRMTELYAKACLDARDIHPTDVPAFIACMAEKFAELIVRECIETIKNASMDSGDEWEDGLRFAQGAIEEHFGIGMSTEDKKTLIKELLGVKND